MISGANGTVIFARHILLPREEVIKVWHKTYDEDLRDKYVQGQQEVAKLVAVESLRHYVVRVFGTQTFGKYLACFMERVEGKTLKEFLSENQISDNNLKGLATLFVDAIFAASKIALHGDAHWENVMLTGEPVEGQEIEIRLLDFGTSYFVPSDVDPAERHWKKIDETFRKIVNKHSSYQYALRTMGSRPSYQPLPPPDDPMRDPIVEQRRAYYRDFLDCL